MSQEIDDEAMNLVRTSELWLNKQQSKAQHTTRSQKEKWASFACEAICPQFVHNLFLQNQKIVSIFKNMSKYKDLD